MFSVFYEEGFPNKMDEYIWYILLITPFLTIYYLIFVLDDKEESVISLWVKLKRKNLKDELKK
jgi:hypothetical protein